MSELKRTQKKYNEAFTEAQQQSAAGAYTRSHFRST